MSPEQINLAIERKEVVLSKSEKIVKWFYLFLAISITVFLVDIIISISNNLMVYYTSIVFMVLIMAMFIRNTLTSAKLKVYGMNISTDKFRSANKAVAKMNGWTVKHNHDNYFSADTFTGEFPTGIITAIFKNGKLYINNRGIFFVIFPINLNDFTSYKLIEMYKAVLKGESPQKNIKDFLTSDSIEFLNESEWTFANTLQRIIGYILILLFAGINCILLYEGSYNIYAFFALCLCCAYTYYDIKIVRKKREWKKNKNSVN